MKPHKTYRDHIARFADQLEPIATPAGPPRRAKAPGVLVIAGMGGSGLAGDLVAHFRETLRLPVPVVVWKGFGLPALPFARPLVIAVSHSGRTAETISAFRAARRRGYEVGAAATGGALLDLARAARTPRVAIPTLPGLTPREGIGYTYYALVELLRTWFPNIRNPGLSQLVSIKQLEKSLSPALKTIGRNSVSVFAPTGLEVVGYVWKVVLSETAKRRASLEVIPEAAHNAIMGFSRRPDRTSAVFISSSADGDGARRTAEAMRRIIARGGTPTIAVPLAGRSLEERTWNGILLGHMAALGLAERDGANPSATPLTDAVKRRMRK